MKSWFAANIDTNKGLSGPFLFSHVPATRKSGDASTAPTAVGLLTENSVKEAGFKNHQTDPECPLGLE